MKVLITGAGGFIGRNLIAELGNQTAGDHEILFYDVDTPEEKLEAFCAEAGFVFHLAGVNRPEDPAEFMKGNFGFTSLLLDALKKAGNKCPVMLSSSIQAALDNPYGESKRAGEELLLEYGRETGAPVYVYRFPNVFGKWCRPNYNSAVATFCHNLNRGLPITVNDPKSVVHLVYIDDVVKELVRLLAENSAVADEQGICHVSVTYQHTLEHIVNLLYTFRDERTSLAVPDLADPFTKKLYSTWISYLPEDAFSYPLTTHEDHRGSFTEFLRSEDRGQVSVNISKPGVVKGNHWHHTKVEKYLVVSGTGVIRFRKVGFDQIHEYFASGEKLEVIDIPAGYTHNIENLGETDMVTIMWASEPFDPDRPDTWFMEV